MRRGLGGPTGRPHRRRAVRRASCLGYRGAAIDASTWPLSRKHPDPPLPSAAGQDVGARWEGLEQNTTYWTAVRVQSGDSLWSPLAVVRFTTAAAIDLAPPTPPSDLRIAGVDASGRTRLEWDASPEPDLAGYQVYGRHRRPAVGGAC